MLFTRNITEDMVGVTTDGVAKRMLLTRDAEYAEWHDPGPDDTVLLVVSAMNDEESKLMVMPAVHSPPIETVLSHLAGAGAHARDGCVPQTHPTCLLQRIAAVTPSLFDALPLPSHIDDWLAQVSSPFRVLGLGSVFSRV